MNERAQEAIADLERLAAELLMLAKYADEETGMRMEDAIEQIAKAGIRIRKTREGDMGID